MADSNQLSPTRGDMLVASTRLGLIDVPGEPDSGAGGDAGSLALLQLTSKPCSERIPPFLTKLYQIVSAPATDECVRWGVAGCSFVILDTERLAETLPSFFKHNNVRSFVRQLNTYGFRKLTNISSSGGHMEFAHEHFQRNEITLLASIKRAHSSTGQGHSGSLEGQSGSADPTHLAGQCQSQGQSLSRSNSGGQSWAQSGSQSEDQSGNQSGGVGDSQPMPDSSRTPMPLRGVRAAGLLAAAVTGDSSGAAAVDASQTPGIPTELPTGLSTSACATDFSQTPAPSMALQLMMAASGLQERVRAKRGSPKDCSLPQEAAGDATPGLPQQLVVTGLGPKQQAQQQEAAVEAAPQLDLSACYANEGDGDGDMCVDGCSDAEMRLLLKLEIDKLMGKVHSLERAHRLSSSQFDRMIFLLMQIAKAPRSPHSKPLMLELQSWLAKPHPLATVPALLLGLQLQSGDLESGGQLGQSGTIFRTLPDSSGLSQQLLQWQAAGALQQGVLRSAQVQPPESATTLGAMPLPTPSAPLAALLTAEAELTAVTAEMAVTMDMPPPPPPKRTPPGLPQPAPEPALSVTADTHVLSPSPETSAQLSQPPAALSAPGLSHPLGLVAPPGISAEGEQLLVLRAAYSQDLAQLQAQLDSLRGATMQSASTLAGTAAKLSSGLGPTAELRWPGLNGGFSGLGSGLGATFQQSGSMPVPGLGSAGVSQGTIPFEQALFGSQAMRAQGVCSGLPPGLSVFTPGLSPFPPGLPPGLSAFPPGLSAFAAGLSAGLYTGLTPGLSKATPLSRPPSAQFPGLAAVAGLSLSRTPSGHIGTAMLAHAMGAGGQLTRVGEQAPGSPALNTASKAEISGVRESAALQSVSLSGYLSGQLSGGLPGSLSGPFVSSRADGSSSAAPATLGPPSLKRSLSQSRNQSGDQSGLNLNQSGNQSGSLSGYQSGFLSAAQPSCSALQCLSDASTAISNGRYVSHGSRHGHHRHGHGSNGHHHRASHGEAVHPHKRRAHSLAHQAAESERRAMDLSAQQLAEQEGALSLLTMAAERE